MTTKINSIDSLYIHIPFCKNICFYCDFPKLLKNSNFEERYLKTLINELKSLNINHSLKTIYIGGGTPTCVNLKPLLIELQPLINKHTEFTIEGNVLDLDEEKLKMYRKYQVNRLSLGVQSMNDDILLTLGRKHTKMDVINKINLAKQYFKNINIDLIYGFKELSNEKLIDELKEYLALDVKHISTYSLEIHPGTKFFNEHKEELDSSVVREQFDLIYNYLTKNGYKRYEISNFAKKGYQSRHNLTYWKDNEYYGIGLGAASYTNHVRKKNTLNMNKYLENNYVGESESISLEDDKKYYLMLNLRLKDGVSLRDYRRRFNVSLLKEKGEILKKLKLRKLIKITYNRIVATYEGSMLLDVILKELF